MANGTPGSSPPAPLPGWLGPIVTVTTQVGVPTVIAGVLLWFVLTRMGTTLDVIEHAEEDRTRIVAAMQETLVDALDRQTKSFEAAMHENIMTNQRIAEDMKRDRQELLQRFRTPSRAGAD